MRSSARACSTGDRAPLRLPRPGARYHDWLRRGRRGSRLVDPRRRLRARQAPPQAPRRRLPRTSTAWTRTSRRRWPRARAAHASMLRSPRWSGAYDLVMLHHSLEHIPDQVQALREAARLTSPRARSSFASPSPTAWRGATTAVDWVQLDAPRHLYLHTRRSLGHPGRGHRDARRERPPRLRVAAVLGERAVPEGIPCSIRPRPGLLRSALHFRTRRSGRSGPGRARSTRPATATRPASSSRAARRYALSSAHFHRA